MSARLGFLFSEDIIHIKQILSDLHLADCYSAIDIFVLIAEQGESLEWFLLNRFMPDTSCYVVDPLGR